MGARKQELMELQEQKSINADLQTACDLLLSELVYILDELLALGVSESEIEKKINKGNSGEWSFNICFVDIQSYYCCTMVLSTRQGTGKWKSSSRS